jgi:hypothetical protein
VISRVTVIWLVLLLGFSAALWYDGYQQAGPCRQWKAAHPGVDPNSLKDTVEEEPDGTYTMSFNPCTVVVWRSMPFWVKLCAIGWLVSLIGFLRSFVRDVVRYLRARRHTLGVPAFAEQQPPKL